jgi:hypothetical protein
MQKSYLDQLTESGVGPQSFGTIAETARTGLPTNFTDAFNTLKASQQRFVDEGRANLIEKYGAKGLRFSQPMANAAVDYESQVSKDFASILAEFTRQATEAAAGRRLEASRVGLGFAQEPAMAMRPTEALFSGGASAVGAGFQAGSSAIQDYLMLRALGAFGGGGGNYSLGPKAIGQLDYAGVTG